MDAGHLCLTNPNEVTILRRLPEKQKSHAMHILGRHMFVEKEKQLEKDVDLSRRWLRPHDPPLKPDKDDEGLLSELSKRAKQSNDPGKTHDVSVCVSVLLHSLFFCKATHQNPFF